MKKNRFTKIAAVAAMGLLISSAIFAVFFLSGCMQPSEPLNKSVSVSSFDGIVPADNLNPYQQFVANMHNGALDYVIAHAQPGWYGNMSYHDALEDTAYDFVRDSMTLTGMTPAAFADSVMKMDTSQTMLQSDSIALSAKKITALQKYYLDETAKLFDSVNIYDSTDFINRVTTCEKDVTEDTLTSDEQCYVLTIIAVGKASYYYWNAQAENPLSPWAPCFANAAKQKHFSPLWTGADTKACINSDLGGAGVALGTLIGAAIVTIWTGVGIVPAFTAGAAVALQAGLSASAWTAFWILAL